MRMAAIAGSMALALSVMATPAVMAQDGPEATIQGFMDAVVAKDVAALPTFFCEAEADQAARFDMSALTGDMEGLDVQSVLDAVIFDVQLDSLEVTSQTDTEAIVHIVGSMSIDIDPEPLVPLFEAVIAMSGMEADEATVDMFMGMILAEFEAQAEDIDADVTLVPGEDMAWLICSDLDLDGGDASNDE
jgi:hypothetical protein